MRRVVSWVCLANALYFGLIGLSGLFSPGFVSTLLHIGVPDPTEAGLVRLLCAMVAIYALLLFELSKQGEGARALARVALAGAAINLVAELAACMVGELGFALLGAGMLGQVALIAALLVWMRMPGARAGS